MGQPAKSDEAAGRRRGQARVFQVQRSAEALYAEKDSDTREAHGREAREGRQEVRHLLEEVLRLRCRTYLDLPATTDVQSIPDRSGCRAPPCQRRTDDGSDR